MIQAASNPAMSDLPPMKPIALSAMEYRFRRQLLRMRVHDPEFTIVSNNCWGAHIYQNLGEPYRTPFVGLFLAPECYLRLLKRLR
jgi:uncharacterized protein (DUF1919 family)